MAKYKFVIEKEDKGYLFILYPNNSNTKEVGRSIYYLNKSQCLKALNDFKLFVDANIINTWKSKFININNRNGKWFFEYIKDGKVIFYRYCGYDNKDSACKIIGSIYKNITFKNP